MRMAAGPDRTSDNPPGFRRDNRRADESHVAELLSFMGKRSGLQGAVERCPLDMCIEVAPVITRDRTGLLMRAGRNHVTARVQKHATRGIDRRKAGRRPWFDDDKQR